jgi:hypothetical protein
LPFRLKRRAEELARSSDYAPIVDGKQDALRHLIGSALVTQAYGTLLAWLAGELSEFGAWIVRYNTTAQRDMDRHNNAAGREIGRAAADEAEIVRLAHAAIDERRARWLVDR